MKKLLLTALIAVSLISSSFAASPVNDKKVSSIITSSFGRYFRNVSNVHWDVTPNFAKATFVNNDVTTEAFFDLNGDFIGSSRAITLDKLPTAAKRTFAKRYADYTVKEAIEFNGSTESAYYISAENEKQSVILKVLDNTLEVYNVTTKR
jgi:opacity protein-like surface antigen